MNIGFIYGVPIWPPGVGGSIHGYQLAKGLAERGHELRSWYYGDEEVPFVRHFRGRQLLAFVHKLDVLYLRVSWNPAMYRFARLRWLRLGQLPIVWELNGLPQENLYYRGGSQEDVDRATAGLRKAGRRVTAAIGVTEKVRAFLRQEAGIENAYCIPNGSDPELFRPRQDPDPSDDLPLRVVWMGGRSPWHDVDTIVEAAALLEQREANVTFDFYGVRTAVPENLPDNVNWAGKVPYAEISEKLGRADVGIHLVRPACDGRLPSGSPLKIFDYMASGLAILARPEEQWGAILRQTGAGIGVDGTPENLAEAIAGLEADRKQCRRLGAAGRRAVEDYYNWGRVAGETEQVLQAAVNGSPAS